MRAWRARARLEPVRLRPIPGGRDDVLVFVTLRNERVRLPFFLEYYRKLHAAHFLIVDNGSTDGSTEYLAAQPDVSLWRTRDSYRRAAFGMDWMNALLGAYAHRRWALTVDVDEFLVYPFCDTRPLPALVGWLAEAGVRSFGALLLDLYPKGPVAAAMLRERDDPIARAPWFDAANYTITVNPWLKNLWVQGGPRARAFLVENPNAAPALNKIPLVHWRRGYAYVSSTHMLLPRGLNLVYETNGGEKASGCLLHTKFLATLAEKAQEELQRGEHYAQSREYRAYAEGLDQGLELWHPWSERFINWRQLEILGLMSKGSWA